MLASIAARSAARVGGRRTMSTAAAPKLHKYRDVAPELAKTRPPPGHDHVSRTIIILRPVPLPVLMNLLTTGGGGRDAAALYPCFSFYIINYIRLGMGGRGGDSHPPHRSVRCLPPTASFSMLSHPMPPSQNSSDTFCSLLSLYLYIPFSRRSLNPPSAPPW